MPPEFSTRVGDEAAAVQAFVSRHGRVPRWSGSRAPRSGDLAGEPVRELWQDESWRQIILTAQHAKCAFCECRVDTHAWPLDHFAPKSRVDELVSAGSETATGAVHGRHLRGQHPVGYWYLAYVWTNYLAACFNCSTRWKKTLFPTSPPAAPSPGGAARPLVLNPFCGPDPELHLRFDQDGLIHPRSGSAYGFETIRVCGLDRTTLNGHRKRTAMSTDTALDQVLQLALARTGTIGWWLDWLRSLTAPDALHAGTARSLVRDHLAAQLGAYRVAGAADVGGLLARAGVTGGVDSASWDQVWHVFYFVRAGQWWK